MTVSSQLKDFSTVLNAKAPDYGVTLDAQSVEDLTQYYDFLTAWNARLHLVAPTTAEEFATRHVLESLVLVNHLTARARIADVGSGGGLPILPCLIVRPDITATLFESSKKKAVFLREAMNEAKVADRAAVVADRFENVASPAVEFVTCRAIEGFEALLPTLIDWTPSTASLLLFGSRTLGAKLAESGKVVTPNLLPNSERRFLFIARNN